MFSVWHISFNFSVQGCQIAGGKNTVIAYKPKYIDAGRDDTTNLYTFQYIGDMDPDIKKYDSFLLYLKLHCLQTVHKT